jgi:hypothetical protein
MSQVTLGYCLVNSSASFGTNCEMVSTYALRTTGAVPQSGTAAALGTVDAGTADVEADAGAAVGALVGDGVVTAPGAAHPVTMMAASPRPATVR